MAASLFSDPPPDLSLTASNSTCTLLHPVCSLSTAISSLFSPLKYHQKLFFLPLFLSVCFPLSLSFSLCSPPSSGGGGGGGVLERCSVTAKCLLRGAKKNQGGGETCGRQEEALLPARVPVHC